MGWVLGTGRLWGEVVDEMIVVDGVGAGVCSAGLFGAAYYLCERGVVLGISGWDMWGIEWDRWKA